MTAPEVATFVKERAIGSENAARTSGVDELRMSRVRDYVLRYQDKEAMTAFLSGREAVALHATYSLICAHLDAAQSLPSVDDEPTDPVITLPADRGGK